MFRVLLEATSTAISVEEQARLLWSHRTICTAKTRSERQEAWLHVERDTLMHFMGAKEPDSVVWTM